VSTTPLEFGEATLRILDDATADVVQTAMSKRLISMARPTDIYAPKVNAFRRVTSLTLRVTDSALDHATIRQIGRRYELLIFLTDAFAAKRSQIHRLLGVNSEEYHPSTDLVLPVVGRRWVYQDRFSTRTVRRPTEIQGLPVAKSTQTRFNALGFSTLATLLVRSSRGHTIERAQEALRWLEQSLMEKDASAAIVKTCIGLESLFGFDKSEPLRQSISDRGAFLIARSADDRKVVSKLLRDYYDLRSAIVHGSKKTAKWTEDNQQQLDRFLLVSAISVASLAPQCPSVDTLRTFFESLKWSTLPGVPTSPVRAQLLQKSYRNLEAKVQTN